MSQISSDLLLGLYGAAEAPERWTGFLDRVCRELGVANAAVQCLALRGDRLTEIWCARDSRSMAVRDVHDRLVNNPSNPRFNLSIDQTGFDQKIVRDSDRFAPDCPHYAAFRERLHQAGLGESLCLSVPEQSGRLYSLVVHHSNEARRGFDEGDESFLLQLSPHLEQALRIGGKVEAQSTEIEALHLSLERLRVGIAVSRDGRTLTWANAAAQDILRHSPHLAGLDRAGGLARFHAGDGTSSLTILAAGEEDELQVLSLCGDPSLAAPDLVEPGVLALLLVEPRRAPDLAPDELARVLGITRGEGRIAAWLAGGGTIKDFASYRGLSEGSVRNQAKQTLAKAGVPRQADLVRHICSSIPGLLRGPIS